MKYLARPSAEPLEMPRIGFDTIGNATIIVYDHQKPVVCTDPWIQGPAYFGSWTFSHEIPEEQMNAVKNCPFIWFSHGHPDHLNPNSIDLFKGKTILLPDHAGKRIQTDLIGMGHTTRILPDREWVSLSTNVKVMCIADYFQDAILLIDVNGKLLLDLNDAIDRGWGSFVRKIVKKYEISFLLSLFGYGDADMINFRDEKGILIPPKAAKRHPVGEIIAAATSSLGVRYFIPFSSMHRYQRTDSIWAEEFVTHLDDYSKGFTSDSCEILSAFLRFDAEKNLFAPISPPEAKITVHAPEVFGDNWNDTLDPSDVKQIQNYLGSIEHLKTFLDFVEFRVGGKDYSIDLAKSGFNRGIRFEVPRGSLMTAVDYRIFDDLLIGNFMKTTLVGKWPQSKLYPDFIPYVARYADNANARTKEELREYFGEYQKRQPIEYFLHTLEQRSIDLFRAKVEGGSPLFEAGKKAYWWVKGLNK
jgi:L-ascorbate metabolism protein UlaG (beta-lactamase superfamily)